MAALEGLSALWLFGSLNADNTVAETLDIFLQTPRLNAWIFEWVRPWCGRRVLEVGSGIGNLTCFLLDRDLVIATDIEHEFVDRLRARFRDHPNVIVSRLGLGNFDVESIRCYAPDTVLCVNVLVLCQTSKLGFPWNFHQVNEGV